MNQDSFDPGDVFGDIPEDADPVDPVVRPSRPRREWKGPKPDSLPVLTGFDWPPKKGQDPRMVDLLLTLREKSAGGVSLEELIWVICAAAWWLDRGEAVETAALIGRLLAARSGPVGGCGSASAPG